MNKSKIFGITAIASLLGYIYYSKKEETAMNLEGVNVDINSEKLVGSIIDQLDLKNQSKQVVKNLATNLTSHAVDKLMK